MKVAMTKRNELAHRGASIPRERLLKTLRAVREILWRLDVARGHSWAQASRGLTLAQDPAVGYRQV
jgi:hypothetical protein